MDGPSANEYKFTQSSHPETILAGLQELRKKGEFCDVTLSADGIKFPVHKNVLCAVSPYFKAMFSGSLAEAKLSTVTLQGVDGETLSLLLDYAYTSYILITRHNVQSILSAANLIQIIPVKEAACRFLEQHMDPSNCLGIHCFAEYHACEDLKMKSFNYALQNFSEVVHHEEFLTLTSEKLIEFTSSDDLLVNNEELVFEAVVRWHDHKPDQRASQFVEVLKTVRLLLLNPYYIVDCVDQCAVINSSRECLDLIEEAKLYHLLPDRQSELANERSKLRTSSESQEVIISVGGEDDKVVLRSVESYCPNSKEWKKLCSLPFGISKHGTVSSGKNTVYLAGGEFPDGNPSRFVWRYDPVLDLWQEMESLIVPRSELGLAMLDGYIYAVGGWEGNHKVESVEKYDSVRNKWSFVAPMKTPLMSASVISCNGMLYVAGGDIHEECDGISVLQRYDPRSNKWTEMASMGMGRSGAAVCVINSHIYVIGGYDLSSNFSSTVECYDIKADKWQYKASMCKKRYKPGISVVSGLIYVLGGEESHEKYHESIESYDPRRDEWRICGKMLTARSCLSCLSLRVHNSWK